MDSHDDFEFKPLTEGLGFNKPAEKSSDPMADKSKAELSKQQPTGMLSELQNLMNTLPPVPASGSRSKPAPDLTVENEYRTQAPAVRPSAVTKEIAAELSRPRIYQPVGRADYQTQANSGRGASIPVPGTAASMSQLGIQPSTPSRDPGGIREPGGRDSVVRGPAKQGPGFALPNFDIEPTAPARQRQSEQATEKATEKSTETPIAACLSAGLLDGIFILGFSTLCLVSVLVITRVNFVALLTSARADYLVQSLLVVLYLMVMHLYLLVSRSTWFGRTLGEWSFDVKLGTEAQQQSAWYPVQVVWRTLLITATGIVIIPILSKAFGRDFLRSLTGLQIYSTF